MKFRDLASEWIEHKRYFVKKSSLSAYILLLENHVLPEFGDSQDEIQEDQVQKFVLNKMGNGLRRKSVIDILVVLNMVLKFGKKTKKIDYEPFDIVFPSSNEKKGLEVLTITQTNKLINYLKENFTFKNLGLLITISTGMRIGEICALQWEDVDIERGVITVQKTIQRVYIIAGDTRKTELILDSPKTSSSNREIPLSSDLIKILKPLKKLVNPCCFVLSNHAKPIEPRAYRSYYIDLMLKLALPPMKFHGLRHSFATRCVNANIDIKTVSVLLGHANVSTTLNIYAHPDLEQKKSAIGKMFKSLK